MGIGYFVLSIVLALILGLFVNAIFQHQSRVKFLLSWFILVFASVVLSAEVCSLFSILNQGGFLAFQVVLCLLGWGIWKLFKEPPLNGTLNWHFYLPKFRENWLLYVFSITCLAAYLINAFIILRVPQNNYDSMTYHLARVGYWMQNENLYPWDTSNDRQTSFPPNAEIGSLWSMLFLRSDILTGFVQWSFAAAGFIAIYAMSSLLGASRKQGWFAGLAWLTLPQVVLQSTTTQNDIVVSTLILIAVYFLYQGWISSNTGELALSGIALGLALGTKLTAGMAVVGLGIVCLILWMKSRRPSQFFFALATSYILGFLIFGSLGYIQNVIFYGTPLGPEENSGAALAIVQPGLRIKLQNLLVYAYQFLDFAGLPPRMAEYLVELKAKLAAPIFSVLKLGTNYWSASISQILNYPPRLHEDFTWFGPLSMLAILPSLVIFAWQSIKRKSELLGWGTVLIGLLFTGVLILQGWSPHKSRYIILTVTLLAPLLFYFYNERKPFYTILLIGVSSFVLWHTVLFNESKPLIGPNAFWSEDELTLRTINNPQIKPLAQAVDEYVPSESRLAIKLGSNGWDYVFFGKGFTRNLNQFRQETASFFGQQVILTNWSADAEVSHANTTLEDLARENAEYLVVGPQQEFFVNAPAGLVPILESDIGSIYRLAPEDLNQPRAAIPISLPGKDATGIVQVNPDLVDRVGVMGAWSASWGIEEYQGDSFLWLGQGEAQGLGARLWSEVDLVVCAKLTLLPGPSREDALRTVSLLYLDEDTKRVVETAQFDRQSELAFPLPLHPGVNPFGVLILEPATIPKLPNGDERQLLARLNQIEIASSTGTCP